MFGFLPGRFELGFGRIAVFAKRFARFLDRFGINLRRGMVQAERLDLFLQAGETRFRAGQLLFQCSPCLVGLLLQPLLLVNGLGLILSNAVEIRRQALPLLSKRLGPFFGLLGGCFQFGPEGAKLFLMLELEELSFGLPNMGMLFELLPFGICLGTRSVALDPE